MITKKKETAKPPFLKRRVPLIVFVFFVALCGIGCFIMYCSFKPPKRNYQADFPFPDTGPSIKLIRENNNGLINPLLFVENTEPDTTLLQLKGAINELVDKKKEKGILTSATVYVEKLNSEKYMEINPEEDYEPASLIKIATLVIYLKQAESNAALLDKKIDFIKPMDDNLTQTIKEKGITPGKSYTVRELLYYMIVYSDNEAYYLLTMNMDDKVVTKTFDDLKFPLHVYGNSKALAVTAGNYSHFFKVLYNASYLSRDMSQYALTLLTQSTFKEGIAKPIDPTIKVAHKFGERTRADEAELHEFGIVYLQNNPYLIGVMTKGHDVKQLTLVISEVSQLVYEEMK